MYLLLIIIIISKCTQFNYVNYIEENDAIFRSFEEKCRLEVNCISIAIKLYVYNSICYLIMYLSSVIVIIFICIFSICTEFNYVKYIIELYLVLVRDIIKRDIKKIYIIKKEILYIKKKRFK